MRKYLSFIIISAIAVLWIGIFLAPKWSPPDAKPEQSAEAVADRFKGSSHATTLPVLWDAPAFSYPDQNGRTFTDTDLRGRIWISDFFFSSCTSICPVMTSTMLKLEKSITDPRIQFVSFSVDPDHDTPAVLKQYSRMFGADESRWHFLSTDAQKLAKTAAGMRTFVRPPDKDSPIQHSSIFILTDGDGKVRGVYDSHDPFAMYQLGCDALTLAGLPTDSMPQDMLMSPMPDGNHMDDSPGARLFAMHSCVACHSQQKIGPPLKGLFNQPVVFEDGRTVMADEAYIRQSILDPNSRTVVGYPRLMPSYKGQLTDEEVSQLVDYIKLQSGGPTDELLVATTQPAPSGQAVDPVCKMLVAAHDPTLHTEFNGKTYYFCSTTCRDQFLKDPAKFIANLPAQLVVAATRP